LPGVRRHVRDEVLPLKPAFRDIAFHSTNFTRADIDGWLESIGNKITALRKLEIDGWAECLDRCDKDGPWWDQGRHPCSFHRTGECNSHCASVVDPGNESAEYFYRQNLHYVVLKIDLKRFEDDLANGQIPAENYSEDFHLLIQGGYYEFYLEHQGGKEDDRCEEIVTDGGLGWCFAQLVAANGTVRISADVLLEIILMLGLCEAVG
jgi:hypothetical protein